MRKFLQIFLLLVITNLYAQVNFSNTWEDFYSYNNVKDFVKSGHTVYAISDNSLFIYNELDKSIEKLSSVHGLSGEVTSTLSYSKTYDKIIIGYQSGLIEIIDKYKNVVKLKDIVNFNYTGTKSINGFFEYDNKLYIATSFGIVVFNLEKLQFGDTYFIGDQSSELAINEIVAFDNQLIAATENGIYTADITNTNLIDFNNWKRSFSGNFPTVKIFNNKVYTIGNRILYEIKEGKLITVKSYAEVLVSLKTSENHLTITTSKAVYINGLDQVQLAKVSSPVGEYILSLNAALFDQENLFLATKDNGILKTRIDSFDSIEEIRPDGPLSNDPFSLAVKNNNICVVYGSYNASYTPLGKRFGISIFSSNKWNNIPYSKLNKPDLVHATFDPFIENRIYLSSWGAGMLTIENNEVVEEWNHLNSGLERLIYTPLPNYVSTRINGSAFDAEGNLWIANGWVDKRVKKYSKDGVWSGFDMSTVLTNEALGLNELVIDKTNTVWIGTRRNGVLVFNENGNRKRAIFTEETQGALPDLNVRTVQVDNGNRLWIGTKAGLVVLYNASSVFDSNSLKTEPVIILDNGVPKKLLGEDTVNSIAVDGADNKWFGTETGGAIQTNPNGTKMLNQFNKDNSPLPSNNILKIVIDKNSGKVYFATDKGIVVFKSNVASYSNELPEVYAYPNPAKKEHDIITIDGRNGAHLPQKTNVKIIDTAGNLVYETNVKEGQELFGGKVVWDKRNLAGKKVSSGIYIVLLTYDKGTQTAMTKVAIIN